MKKCSEKDVLANFTGKYPSRSAISIKLLSKFIEITIRLWYSPVNLPHIFRTLFWRAAFDQFSLSTWLNKTGYYPVSIFMNIN